MNEKLIIPGDVGLGMNSLLQSFSRSISQLFGAF
jgi:hypothetical protein